MARDGMSSDIERLRLSFTNWFYRRSVLPVVRRTVSITRMLTTTPFTLNQRISLLSTKLFPQSHHTSRLPLALVTFTVFTSQVTSSSAQSFLASTKPMSSKPLEQRTTSQSSWSSTVDLDLPSKSSWMPSPTVLLRSTLIPICNSLTSLVSETTSLRTRITS